MNAVSACPLCQFEDCQCERTFPAAPVADLPSAPASLGSYEHSLERQNATLRRVIESLRDVLMARVVTEQGTRIIIGDIDKLLALPKPERP